jgi:hypothetical protein
MKLWMVYAAVWVIHLVGFFISDLRDDVQGMVWFGFLGMMWLYMAVRARDAA